IGARRPRRVPGARTTRTGLTGTGRWPPFAARTVAASPPLVAAGVVALFAAPCGSAPLASAAEAPSAISAARPARFRKVRIRTEALLLACILRPCISCRLSLYALPLLRERARPVGPRLFRGTSFGG